MSIRLISMASALALTLAASAASAMPASGEQPLFNDQADVPSVVTRAEEILQDLERSGAAGPRRLAEAVTSPKSSRAAAMQVSLFADVHPVVEALRKLDVNSLTPLDALNRLFELQRMASDK